MKRFFFILFVLNSYSSVAQQLSLDSIQNELLYYSDIMVNAQEEKTRIRASLQFEEYFNEYLKLNGPLGKDLNHLKYISQLSPEDESFTLVSWLIKENENSYDYKAFLIKKDRTVIPFNRTDPLSESTAFAEVTPQDWYGCMYNHIHELGKNEYLIFGFDLHSKFDRFKLVDYLKVDDKGVTLGKDIFEDKEERTTYLNRLVVSYSSDAVVSLKYNRGLKMIIQDHLQEIMGLQPGQGPTNIPDGTYEGYAEKKGKWEYVEKIYDHVYEKPPRPKPVLDDKTKKVYEK